MLLRKLLFLIWNEQESYKNIRYQIVPILLLYFENAQSSAPFDLPENILIREGYGGFVTNQLRSSVILIFFKWFNDGWGILKEQIVDLDGHSIGIAVALNPPKFRCLDMGWKKHGVSVRILIKQAQPSEPWLFGIYAKISGPFWIF